MDKKIEMDSIYLSAQKPTKPCQDYCLVDPYLKMMVLSDGCSSSKNTDIGARILCHSAKSIWNKQRRINRSFRDFCDVSIIHTAFSSIKLIDLEESCLDATLIIVSVDEDEIKITTYGDGSFVVVDKNGQIDSFVSFSYDLNAPYYLSYLLNYKRSEEYKKSVKTKNVVTYSENKTVTEAISPWIHDISIHKSDDLSMIMITSDGIESFFNYKTGERIPSIEIVKELVNFKSKKGDFVKRRVRRMMDDFAKQDIYNSDDLSVCAMFIEEIT